MNLGDSLLRAHTYVTGDRQEQHGNPKELFEKIAAHWSIWLEKDITAHDVAMMMSLLKAAREKQNPLNRDNLDDMAGYIALAEFLKYP